jgi:mannose-1-phosphate guanylyltransferase
MKKYSVIMAGGGGTRFWPLSRQSKPKQVLSIAGNDTMINQTIGRHLPFIPIENTYIVTNRRQKKILTEVVMEGMQDDHILIEPFARNTAPCILLSAMKLYKMHGDGVMCVYPSDHYISNTQEFENIMQQAITVASETDKLVTIGIKPTFPSTGYGYIAHQTNTKSTVYDVQRFVEKPNLERAKQYMEAGNYLWNSGMFIWKLSVILENFERFLPRMYESMVQYMNAIGTNKETSTLEVAYKEVDSISIDYGIMERANDVLVIPGDFGWNDVGSWDALAAIYPPDDNQNIVNSDFIGLETSGTIVYSEERLIATIGLKDMIVVDSGDAIMVCPKERAQDVKNVVEELKKRKRDELL